MTQILETARKTGHTEAVNKFIELAQKQQTSVLELCSFIGRVYSYEKHDFSKTKAAIDKQYESDCKEAETKGLKPPIRPIYTTKDQHGMMGITQARKYASVGAYFLRAMRRGVSIGDLEALELLTDLGIERLAVLAKLSESRAEFNDIDKLIELHNAIEAAVRTREVVYADVVRFLKRDSVALDEAIERAVTLKIAREAQAKAKEASDATETVRRDGADIVQADASLEQIATLLLRRADYDVERAQKALLSAIAEYERARAQAVSQAVETVAVA